MCHKHYARVLRGGEGTDPRIPPRPLEYEVDEKGCFNITSHARDKDGYSRVSVNYNLIGASKLIYQEMYGEVPEGRVIRHTCDNPRCINPEHLLTGTHADNARDKTERGRQVKGEKVWSSVLTEEDVLTIREYSQTMSTTEIMSKYNVSRSTINRIINRKIWRHI